MSLGVTVNSKRNGMLLAYIAGRFPDIHLRKLLKTVYLLDESFVLERGFPLTWFNYHAWAKGPVAPEVYAVKDGAWSEYVHARKNDAGKWVVSSNVKSEFKLYKQLDAFSQWELQEIDRILDKCAAKSADELSDMTHRPDSLWTSVVKENGIRFSKERTQTDIEIDLKKLLKEGDPRREVFEEAEWDMEFQAMLNNRQGARNV